MTITLNGTTGITLPNGSASAPAATGSDTDTGIVYGTNTVSLATGGTTAVTVDSSQNVGIGTSSPAKKLDITGTYRSQIDPSNSSFFGATLTLAGDNGTNQSGARVVGGYEGGFGLLFQTSTGGQAGLTSDPSLLTYTTKMKIDSSGNLLVGQTSGGLVNNNSFYLGIDGNGLRISHVSGTASGGVYCNFGYNGSSIGSITQSGTTAVAYNTSSDYRLKENIAPMTGALDTVSALKPVTYTWKADGSSGQGFIAHELQAVVPDCVTGEKDAVELVDIKDEEGNVIGQEERPIYQGIDTSFLVATLTAAIQELKAELDTVKTELATLKGTA